MGAMQSQYKTHGISIFFIVSAADLRAAEVMFVYC